MSVELLSEADGEVSTSRIAANLSAATARHDPFDYWLLDRVLPLPMIEAVCGLPMPFIEPGRFDGRRESLNSSRIYLTPRYQADFPVCREVADAFASVTTIRALERLTGAHLTDAGLRIEYCLDIDGFWLEPHCDIPAKRLTLLIYLSDDPNLTDAGTDLYGGAPQHNPAGRASYGRNKGLMFVPGDDTWHGFSPRPIRGLRTSLIINYVSRAWKSLGELARPFPISP